MNPNPQNSPNAEQEEKILAFWSEQDIFNKTIGKDSPMGEFTFFEGPPTANGRPGIHHVAARSFKDIIPRYKTMRGFRVNRKAGWDTHGLPVELQVEKELGLKSKKEIEQFGVEAFNHKCRESVWTYKDEWEALTSRMGYWLDMDHPYITYTNDYIEGVWGVAKKIAERKTADGKDLMYKDFKILPWCSRCGTALSSHELNQPGAYEDVKDVTAYVKFKIVQGQERLGYKVPENAYFLAWTTTPWTLPGNVALAVGSDIDYAIIKTENEEWEDGYYVLAADLVDKVFGVTFGKIKKGDWASQNQPDDGVVRKITCIDVVKGSDMVGVSYSPLYTFINTGMLKNNMYEEEKTFRGSYEVYAADFVTTTDGTGIVHIAPMYGQDDFELATKYDLPKFHIVDESGKYIDVCERRDLKLSGRYVKETDGNPVYTANGKPTVAIDIINDLTARNLLFKKENYVHSYPHCWRCSTPLLYYARGSWYFRMSALRDKLLAANEKINWEPDHIKEGRFGEWLDGIKDWAISRDRYWGTPLPVWETVDGTKKVVIGGIEDLKTYAKKSGNNFYVVRHGQAHSNTTNTWDCGRDPENHLTDLGREQVLAAAQALKEKKVDVIIVSPFLRTQETAAIIAQELGISESDIVTDDRLAEWNVGTEFDRKSLDYFFDVRNKSHDRYSFESHGGESFASVIKRVGECVYEADAKHIGKTVLFVGHGSSIRALEMVAEGFTFEKMLKREAKHLNYKNAEFHEIAFTRLPHNENYELDFHKPYIDQIELIEPTTGEPLKRASEVMDVWFDSGAMPYAQSHVLGTPMNFAPKPADYIAEGVDQTRGWFYTMHAIANLLNDEPTHNYNNVVCLGLLMAADGTKMSKSRGNTVSPWDVFQKFGADVVRFWFYSVNGPGETKNFDEKSLDEVNKKVFNILRNVVSFYEMYAPSEDVWDDQYDAFKNADAPVLDRWIYAKLNQLDHEVINGLDDYQAIGPARAIKDFITELSQWYVRRSRDRFKSTDERDRNYALRTLRVVLRNLVRIMAPFTPFIAEEIFQKVKWEGDPESIHLVRWTGKEEHDFGTVIADMETVRTIVTLGLEARQKANIKVRQPLASLSISSEYRNLGADYLDILKEELNVKEVVTYDSLEKGKAILDTEITPELQAEGDMREIVRAIQEMRKEADLVPSDKVIVSLKALQPEWFSELKTELQGLVGAQDVVWQTESDSVKKV